MVMKTFTILLAACAVLSVAVLSTVRVKPVDACASSNSVTTSQPGTTQANESGEFQYSLYIQSWELTFSPTGLVMGFYPETTTNVNEDETLQFTPDSIYVQGRGCTWDGTDDQIVIKGELTEETENGNLNVKITLGAVGHQYDTPRTTGILHY
jgi:hypothetical protein